MIAWIHISGIGVCYFLWFSLDNLFSRHMLAFVLYFELLYFADTNKPIYEICPKGFQGCGTTCYDPNKFTCLSPSIFWSSLPGSRKVLFYVCTSPRAWNICHQTLLLSSFLWGLEASGFLCLKSLDACRNECYNKSAYACLKNAKTQETSIFNLPNFSFVPTESRFGSVCRSEGGCWNPALGLEDILKSAP